MSGLSYNTAFTNVKLELANISVALTLFALNTLLNGRRMKVRARCSLELMQFMLTMKDRTRVVFNVGGSLKKVFIVLSGEPYKAMKVY